MIFARHLARVLWAAVSYSVASRRIGLLMLVLVGLALVAVASATQAAAPFVLYPFA
ncbi:MAG: hypothetical protein JWM47_1711 [Acidimicrobiales bacterium]|nr:hypothetical protein [Acidimicrobiales bacterium]